MVTDQELAPHIEDIKQALGEKLSDTTIAAELRKYLKLHVPLREAKRGIVQKFGGDPSGVKDSGRKRLSDVTPSDRFLELEVKILSVNEREITVRGEPKVIHYGLMADDSMTRPFTAWEDFGLRKGDVYEIVGAYTKTWRGDPEIQLGNRTKIKLREDVEDFEVSTDRRQEATPTKLKDLKGGTFNIAVTVKVIEVESREVTARGEEKTVYSGLLADETGRARFTAWEDFGLRKGEIVRIENAYIKEWRGRPQVTFDSRADVARLSPSDEDAAPLVELDADDVPVYSIEALHDMAGTVDVAVEGVILEIRDGSGLIERCPMCNRKLQNSECMTHGQVDGQPDLRVKAVLDDGTGALSLIVNRDLTETILERTLDQCLSDAHGGGEDPTLAPLEDRLLALPFVFRGNTIQDDFGLMLIAKDLEHVELDIDQKLGTVEAELEGWR